MHCRKLPNPSIIPEPRDTIIDRVLRSFVRRRGRIIAEELLRQPVVFGHYDRIHIAPSAIVNNAVFNTVSGNITVGEWAMIAHGVYLAAGRHEVAELGAQRQLAAPSSGHDIVVEEGAWIATNVTVLGPCKIGKNAVVAAGSLVRSDVPPYSIFAGVPAKEVGLVPRSATQ